MPGRRYEVERVLTERTRVVRVDAQQEEDFRMIPEKPGISRECFGVEKNIGHMREAALCGALQNFVAVFIECRIVHVGMRVDASGRESAVKGIDARRLLVLGHGLNLRASPSSFRARGQCGLRRCPLESTAPLW